MNNLLTHALKEKRNWAILTAVILLITVVVVPLLMDSEIEEGHIVVGIFEVFLIVFMNTLIDFNYLHDTRKFAYYASKPILEKKRIDIIYLANTMFAAMFLIILWFIANYNQLDLRELFIIPSAWMLIIIILTGLSSLLSGNTIVAAIATWFNFAMPVFILGVIYFIVDIVSDLAVGINTYYIMDYFVDNIYRLDIIYLFDYVNEGSWLGYFITLSVIVSLLYLLVQWVIKIRHNERIGAFLIFDGYKFYVALLLSTLVTYLFTLMLSDNDFIAKILSFIILGSITYYVALVILEKTFKHKAFVYKLLAIFLVIFVLGVSIAGFAVKSAEANIPETQEIKGIIISQSEFVYIDEKEQSVRLSELEWYQRDNPQIMLFTSTEAINVLRDLHAAFVENNRYSERVSFNMVYFLEDGSKINRYFETRYDNDVINNNLNTISKRYGELDEYRRAALPMLYAVEPEGVTLEIYQNVNSSFVLTADQYQELANALISDIEKVKAENDTHLLALRNTNQYFDYYAYDMKRDVEIATKEVNDDYYYIRLYNDEHNQGFDIPWNFTSTRAVLDKYLQ